MPDPQQTEGYMSWFKVYSEVPKHKCFPDKPDFDYRLKREAECRCGKKYGFYSQEDNWPEYYTEIGFDCPYCGAILGLVFPVN